mmetsp:Transcript_38293/g.120571  ORF Transcript_38293/g.120571 Transcript_38293/m.120571 type:complete len:414 (-) Transcript_38293:158-1399(-)
MISWISSVRKGYSKWDQKSPFEVSDEARRIIKRVGSIAVFLGILSIIIVPLLVSKTNQDPCKVWTEVQDLLAERDNITVVIGNGRGNQFIFSRGKRSTAASVPLPVASASKWITATVIMKLVDKGDLSLEDRPSKYLSFWKANDTRGQVGLWHLLSFTSGLVEGGSLRCSYGTNDVVACAREIYEANSNMTNAPGESFYYSGNHLVVAVAMAETRTGRTLNQLLQALVIEELHLQESVHFSLKPPGLNPSGSLVISAIDYGIFLRAMLTKQETFLSPQAYAQLLAPFTRNAKKISTLAPYTQGREWEYGLGHWVECFNKMSCDASNIVCPNSSIQSSLGAFGFYPVLEAAIKVSDLNDHYVIISPQVPTSDFSKNYMLPSVLLHEQVRSKIREAISSLHRSNKRNSVCERRLD